MALRPDQYADPVSLGSLIVAVASLAWTVYSDLRKKTPKPSAEAVARQVRVDLKNYETSGHAETNRITEIVVSEVIYTTREPP
jgi:hypothetical protein